MTVFFKRLFDIVLSLIAMILLSPLYLVLICTNWWFLGRPIFFVQERLGLLGQTFPLLKFRSMRNPSSQQSAPLYQTDQERLTPYGQLLRKLSLDELPSFVNILRGDMSLVGPRPLLPEFWDHYTPVQKRRHWVLPGLTGMAQIHGRNNIPWKKKFQYDLWYVQHRSFCLDIWILLKTIPLLFSGEGTDFPIDGYLPEKKE